MLHCRSAGWEAALTAISRYWLLLLPLVFLLPGIFSFPYPSAVAGYSDIAITHYPNAVYLREALRTWHTIPLWSPLILSGYPFFANPLAGIWYLPGWLAYLFPLPFGFNLSIAIHLLFGGVGMYKLLRVEGLGYRSALFGALAFEAMPKLFAHYGAGHLTLLYAVPWTPWLLLAGRAPGLYLRFDRWSWRVPAGLVLAFIFLADVRWSAYAGLFWLGYVLATDFSEKTVHGFYAVFRRLRAMAGQLILAGLVSAPLALPLLEYTRLSSRAEMTAQDIFTFSLPPARLLGLIIPDFGGFQEYALYPGLVVLLLSGLALVLGVAWSGSRFWLLAGILSLGYALGEHLPYLVNIGRLPGLNLLRVPSRALFITGIALIVLASHALARLAPEEEGLTEDFEKDRRKTRLFLAGAVPFVLILSLAVWGFTGNLPFNFIWGCLLAIGFWLWFETMAGKRLASRYTYGLLIGLCLMDLAVVDLNAYAPRPASQVLAEGSLAIHALPQTNPQDRIYSPSYSIPQQTAGLKVLELADGVDPLQLQSYVDFMKRASGIHWDGYSVTLPAFPDGKPEVDNAWARPDPNLLGLLNVRYVVAAFEQNIPGLILRAHQDGVWIYENQMVRPRAWLQPSAAPTGEDTFPVKAIQWSPNQISVTATTPDGQSESLKLVLSEIYYPGWRVTIDGTPAEIEAEAGLLRSVHVPAGTHTLAFSFRPASLSLGIMLAVVGMFIVCLSGFWHARDQRYRAIGT